MPEIKLFEKGNATRTALHTDAINELVALLNKLRAMDFSPAGVGRLDESDGNLTMTINPPAAQGSTMQFTIEVDGSVETVQITSAEIV